MATGRFLQWFRQRLDRFRLYIDRVIVSATHRRHGLGRLLYEDLIRRAGRLNHPSIACDVNFRPPNPVSDAFHARFGFVEIGLIHHRQYREGCSLSDPGVKGKCRQGSSSVRHFR